MQTALQDYEKKGWMERERGCELSPQRAGGSGRGRARGSRFSCASPSSFYLALQAQHDLLGRLRLLVEDGLGLAAVAGLLAVVAALT